LKIRKYQELCKVCDQILVNNISTPQIVAYNHLHVLNSHPEFLEKYNLSMVNKVWLPFRFWLIFIVRVFQSIFDRRHFYTTQKDIKSDVLLVSHLIDKQKILDDGDAYFGDLSKLLLEQGVNSSTVLINHAKVSGQMVSNGWRYRKAFGFVLSPSLDFLSEIKLYFVQKKSKKQLRFLLKSLNVDKILIRDILRNHLSPDTFNTLRIAKQIGDIVRKTGAKYIITTYEGHAWERLVYYYARKANPSIKCSGYQHAAVFKHQHAIKRLLGKTYNPDVILTSGLEAKEIFKQSRLKERKIICIGSPKYSTPSLVTGEKQCCLVVPEGYVSECLILFKFSLSYAEQYPKQKFIWRLHPLLNFERLTKYSVVFKKIPDNIYLSEDDMDEDIQKCDSVLYRGSTAVVNAINSGLKPIYYQQSSDELNIDPIYTHKEGKSIVHNQEELGLALDRDIDVKTKQSLQNFAQGFYTPLDVGALLKLL